ncbi:MAG: GntR family transcriptional regulator [Angelakisella sp.]
MEINDRIPLYVHVMEYIQNYILENKLSPGDQLPSEADLVNHFKVSRATVRQAMQELVSEGVVEKKHGFGTFVAEPKLSIEMNGFFSFNEETSKQYSNYRTEIIKFEHNYTPSDKVKKRLQLSGNETVLRVERVRIIDDEPVLYETTNLPESVFKHINIEQLNQSSLYSVFKLCNITALKGKERYRPYLPNQKECEVLKIGSNIPAFRFSRLLFAGTQPVEYTVSILKSGKIVMESVIEKNL